jgi:hypothetical protein
VRLRRLFRRGRGQTAGLVALVGLGLFAGGLATGWYAAREWAAPYAPEVVITVAPAGSAGPAGADVAAMPDLRGLSEAEARQAIADLGLGGITVETRQRPSIGAPGTVVAQDPPGGSPVGRSAVLTLAAPAVVPKVVGGDVTSATRDLQALGATVDVKRVYQAGASVDTVLAVEPAAGRPVPERVLLTVAAPPATLFLSELPSPGSDCSTDALPINGVRYERAIRCGAPTGTASQAVYLLNRQAAGVQAVVGQPDTDQPGRTVHFELLGDGKVLVAGDVAYGQSRTIEVPTVNVLRLELRAQTKGGSDTSVGGSVAFGDIRVIGGADAIAALKQPR